MTNPAQGFEDLLRLLEEEAGIYEEMQGLLGEERRALVKLDATALGLLASRKETLALRIKALDESRRILAERLGRGFGIARDQLTVTALCRVAPAAAAGRLESVRARLKLLAENCREINNYNSRAAGSGLALVTTAVHSILDSADPAGKVYAKPGRYAAAGARRPAMVVSKEA